MTHSNIIKSESVLKIEAIASRMYSFQHFHRPQHNISYFVDKLLLFVYV